MNRNLNKYALLSCLVLTGMGWSPHLLACLERPANPPDVWVYGDPCEDEFITFVIHDYTTFAADPTHFCDCALNMPLFLGTVTGVDIVLADTLEPLPGFSFDFNPDTGNAYQGIASAGAGGQWMGFSSGLDQVVDQGIEVDLVYTLVPFRQEIQCDQWLNAVRDFYSPDRPAIATGGGDESGAPSDHITIVPVGELQFRPAISRQDCVKPPAGLAAWWPLDEVFGTTAEDIEAGARRHAPKRALAGNRQSGGGPQFRRSG